MLELEFAPLLIDLGLIIIAATLFGYIARLLKQPSLLAYIIAGIVIGPIGLGAMNYFYEGVQIGISSITDIMIFSELGVAFLLFSVGVESNIKKLLSVGKIAALGATFQVGATILFVLLFRFFFPVINFEQAMYFGVILAFSSTMVVIKLLGDNYQINTLHGRLLIAFLLAQDFLVILAIPILENIGSALSPSFLSVIVIKISLLILAAGVINRQLLPRLFRFSLNYQEEFYLAALSSCFIFIILAALMDLPIVVGAFIGGLALSTLPYNTEIFHKIRGVRDLFVIIFFTSLGMQLSFEFAAIPIALIAFIVIFVLAIKPLMYYFITIFGGYGHKVSLMVAVAMANVSEFSLIVAQRGYDPVNGGVLTNGQFSLIILVISISMVLTPYFMNSYASIHQFLDNFRKKIPDKVKKDSFHRKLVNLEMIPKKMKDHIIILGGGTMGLNIAKALYKHFPTVVIDQDSEVVFSCIRQKINAYYGEADDIEAFGKANPKEAKLVILAIPNLKASLKALHFIKSECKDTPVFARGHYYRDALKLYEAGADFVCMPHVIGSNMFLKNIGIYLNTGRLSTIVNLQDEFIHYLKEKSKEESQHFGF